MRYFRLFDFMADEQGDFYRFTGTDLEFEMEDGSWASQESYIGMGHTSPEQWFDNLTRNMGASGLSASYVEVEAPV